MRSLFVGPSGSWIAVLATGVLLVGSMLRTDVGVAQEPSESYPEAIAVEDVTSLGCEIQTEWYETESLDEASLDDVFLSQPISSRVDACPEGSALKTFPTTVEEAEEKGLPYVVMSGDETQDSANIAALRESVGLAPQSPSGEDSVAASSCRGRGITKTLSYQPGSSGGRVYAKVRYVQTSSCSWYITYSESYINYVSSGVQRFSWDRVYYYDNINFLYWGQGCVSMLPAGTVRSYSYGSAWLMNPGYLYIDQTSNGGQRSLGEYICNNFGEQYTGSVYLIS